MMSGQTIRDVNNIAAINQLRDRTSATEDLFYEYEARATDKLYQDDPEYYDNEAEGGPYERGWDVVYEWQAQDMMMWPSALLEELADEMVKVLRKERALPEPQLIEHGFSFEDLRRIPNLGSYGLSVPDGFMEIESPLFVDKTGMGRDYEPALSIEQFVRKVNSLVEEHPEVYLAIVEEGQFQVHIGVFRRGG